MVQTARIQAQMAGYALLLLKGLNDNRRWTCQAQSHMHRLDHITVCQQLRLYSQASLLV